MAPLVDSVHSIVGLDFAGGLTPGWHETQFPPYFVFGAVLSGFAVVLMLVIPIRRAYRLQARHHRAAPRHSGAADADHQPADQLRLWPGSLHAVLPGRRRTRSRSVMSNLTGTYAPWYWAKIVLNAVIPQLLWFRAARFNRPLLFMISAGRRRSACGSSATSSSSPACTGTMPPSSWSVFTPTFWDWATLAGSIGLFLTGFFLLLRFIPMVSMFEMRELAARQKRGAGGMSERPTAYGLVAEFDASEPMLDALQRLREAGFGRLEVYSPIAVEGVDEILERRPFRIAAGRLHGGRGRGGWRLLRAVVRQCDRLSAQYRRQAARTVGRLLAPRRSRLRSSPWCWRALWRCSGPAVCRALPSDLRRSGNRARVAGPVPDLVDRCGFPQIP